jgi:hypothetical protein
MNLASFLTNIRSKINMVDDANVRKGLLQTVKDFETCTKDQFNQYLNNQDNS